MSSQVQDKYLVFDTDFRRIATDNKISISPSDYGLIPKSLDTAHLKGFWCDFELTDERIFLENLYIHTENDIYPTINGINISPPEYETIYRIDIVNGKMSDKQYPVNVDKLHGYKVYEHLHLPVNYTANLLLGKNFHYNCCFDDKRYFFEYKEVIDFQIEDGKIIKRTDISPLAKSFSEQVKNLKKEYDCFDDFIPIMNKILSKEQINEIWWI